MNLIVQKIVRRIHSCLMHDPNVEGIVVFGSYARAETDHYSDVDLFVFVSDNASKDDVSRNIVNAVGDVDGGILKCFSIKTKNVLYTLNSFTKVEYSIKYISEISVEDLIYIRESRVEIDNALIFDRNGLIRPILEGLWPQSQYSDISTLVLEHVNEFLYYLDGFFVQYSRADVYRAYMNYTIAFYKMGSILSLLYGERRNLYQPWNLSSIVISDDEIRDAFYNASSTMNPLDMFSSKEHLINLFLKATQQISKIYDLDLRVYSFIEAIHSK